MNNIEKLLRKISVHDKTVLLETLRDLKRGDLEKLRLEKISGSESYKLRKGNFRIIFHYENGKIIIDTVRPRN
mgnify:FL=1